MQKEQELWTDVINQICVITSKVEEPKICHLITKSILLDVINEGVELQSQRVKALAEYKVYDFFRTLGSGKEDLRLCNH